jgi:hypothetical protein
MHCVVIAWYLRCGTLKTVIKVTKFQIRWWYKGKVLSSNINAAKKKDGDGKV